jgi:hypothetical protein
VARSRETHGSSKIRSLDRAAALHTSPDAHRFKPAFAAPTSCLPSTRPKFPVTRAPWFRAVSPSKPTPDIPRADRLQGPREFGRAAFGFLRQSSREQIQHRPLRALHFGHRRDRRIVGSSASATACRSNRLSFPGSIPSSVVRRIDRMFGSSQPLSASNRPGSSNAVHRKKAARDASGSRSCRTPVCARRNRACST